MREYGTDCSVVLRFSGQCAAYAAAHPSPQNNPPAQSGFAMMGEWLVDYVSPTGYTASGTLRVTDNLGNGNFRGVMVQSYTSTGGVAKRVQQDMMISVRGDTVVMNASNPVYLQGTGSYSPDNYTLNLSSPNLLRGKNSDNAGVGGAVIVSRR